jgi:ubiquinone/menaquinone biosynthesis C-methylase UbiE
MRTFEQEWRQRFERFAQRHEADHLVSGWSELGLQRRLALFEGMIEDQGLPVSARVLDLGCGAGTYVRFLTGLGHHVVGLDYSVPSLERAIAADPLRTGRYVGGEAYNLPFRSECFDMVLSIGVLQALSYPERALDAMTRVLRLDGILVVEALNGRAVVARARRAGEVARGIRTRVRTFDPRQVQEWLLNRGLHLIRQVPVCLPPRRLPGLRRFLDLGMLARAVEVWPRIAETGAHSFLFAARKGGMKIGQASNSEACRVVLAQ